MAINSLYLNQLIFSIIYLTLNINSLNLTQCPIFECSEGENRPWDSSCAASNFNYNKTRIQVTLFKNACNFYNSKCAFDYSLLSDEKEIYYYCGSKYKFDDYFYKLPGESCIDSFNQCVNITDFVGQCFNRKCLGVNEGEFCKDTHQCKAGTYCNNGVCVKQLKEDIYCDFDYQCENGLICSIESFKCVEPYSREVGEKSARGEECEYGYSVNGLCDKVVYSHLNTNIPNKDNIIPCSPGEDCIYTYQISNETFTRKCECGYNSEGLAYCPIDHNTNKHDWRVYYKALGDVGKNDCHTLNNKTCEATHVKRDYLDYLSTLTVNAHFFYDSPSCALEILGTRVPNFPSWIILVIVASTLVLIVLVVILVFCVIAWIKKRNQNKSAPEPLIAEQYNGRLTSDITCTICFAGPKNRKINCGSPILHELCDECYQKLIITERTRKCPFCRNDIKY